MILPDETWLPLAALGVSLLFLFLWMLRYFRVMKPQRGTLEWIRRADRGRFPPFGLQPLRAKGWIVLIASPLLGLGYTALTAEVGAKGYTTAVLLTMAQTVLCALLLLLLFGAPIPAFCGTVLLTAAGAPSPLLLGILLLMLFSLTCRGIVRQLCLLLPALFALFVFVGCGFPTLVLVVSYLILHLLCANLREPRPSPGVLAGSLLLLLAIAAVFSAAAILYCPFGMTATEAVLTELRRLIQWEPQWQPWTKLPALLPALLIPALLVQARRLRNTAWLFAALAAILGLQMVLCGNPELSYLGCTAALTGTFAGADRRGGRLLAVLTTAILTICIFIL